MCGSRINPVICTVPDTHYKSSCHARWAHYYCNPKSASDSANRIINISLILQVFICPHFTSIVSILGIDLTWVNLTDTYLAGFHQDDKCYVNLRNPLHELSCEVGTPLLQPQICEWIYAHRKLNKSQVLQNLLQFSSIQTFHLAVIAILAIYLHE